MAGLQRKNSEPVPFLSHRALDDVASAALAEVARRRGGMNVPPDPAELDEVAIERIFVAATGSDPLRCGAVARDLLAEGVAPDRICDVIIPEVARRMGDGWTDDTMSFSAVTIGTSRLQYLLREIGHFDQDRRRADDGSAGDAALLLLGSRASDHTLGIMVLASQLRRRGYTVQVSMGADDAEVIEAIRATCFDAIFMSATVDENVLHLTRTVAAMRRDFVDLPPLVLGGIAVDRGGIDIRAVTGVDLVTSDLDAALQHCGLTTARPNHI